MVTTIKCIMYFKESGVTVDKKLVTGGFSTCFDFQRIKCNRRRKIGYTEMRTPIATHPNKILTFLLL